METVLPHPLLSMTSPAAGTVGVIVYVNEVSPVHVSEYTEPSGSMMSSHPSVGQASESTATTSVAVVKLVAEKVQLLYEE